MPSVGDVQREVGIELARETTRGTVRRDVPRQVAEAGTLARTGDVTLTYVPGGFPAFGPIPGPRPSRGEPPTPGLPPPGSVGVPSSGDSSASVRAPSALPGGGLLSIILRRLGLRGLPGIAGAILFEICKRYPEAAKECRALARQFPELFKGPIPKPKAEKPKPPPPPVVLPGPPVPEPQPPTGGAAASRTRVLRPGEIVEAATIPPPRAPEPLPPAVPPLEIELPTPAQVRTTAQPRPRPSQVEEITLPPTIVPIPTDPNVNIGEGPEDEPPIPRPTVNWPPDVPLPEALPDETVVTQSRGLPAPRPRTARTPPVPLRSVPLLGTIIRTNVGYLPFVDFSRAPSRARARDVVGRAEPLSPQPLRDPTPSLGEALARATSPASVGTPTRTGTQECQEVQRRRRRKGKCREGYFEEREGSTRYITWRTRDCMTGQVVSSQKKRKRAEKQAERFVRDLLGGF